MDRTRRDKPEDKVRTSQLIQQLAAQRERKLQGTSSTAHSTLATDVATASSVPLPSSFDEEDIQVSTEAEAAPSSKPRSRLLRQDKAKQPTPAAAGADEVDGLVDLLQGVGLSQNASTAARQPAQQQQHASQSSSRHDSNNSNSSEDAIEDDEFDTFSGVNSSTADATATQRRPTASAASAGRPAKQAVTLSDEDLQDSGVDVASVDSADREGSDVAASSSTQQQGTEESAATAAAAEPLVLDGGFKLEGAVARKLYPHQIHGVKWLWSLHSMGKGGILADDMGLGKTMQCSAFLAGALAASRSSSSFLSANPAAAAASQSAAPMPVRALIVAPKTLLAHWEKELRVCGMGRATYSFYGSSDGERSAVLTIITRRGGIMLTTYGMVLHNASQLMSGKGSAVARDIDENEDEEDLLCPDPPPGRRILWDYIILDEGHKIKNARTQLAQRLREIRARVRIIISGTPVQNNLGELHALMEFATPGLLGSAKDFKAAYDKPINAGQDRSATLRVRELGAARAAELRQLVAPYILRREKKEVLGDGTSNSNTGGQGAAASTNSSSHSGAARVVAAAAVGAAGSSGISSSDGTAGTADSAAGGTTSTTAAVAGGAAGPAPMGKKTDLVVWLKLTALQRHIYEAFLHSDAVKAALNSSKSPLAALTVLKKVCDHPALLSERATKLVVSAASKPSRRKGLETTSTRHGKFGSKVKRRNSMDDFIVDDSDSEGEADAGSDNGSGSQYEEESGSGSESDGSGRAALSSKAAARAAVAASLDNFSEEFLSWATATGGEDLEHKLLSDVGARGTESSCKSLFVAALLDELVVKGHRTLVFSQSRVMLDILQAAVKARGWNFCRIDGSTARADARQAEVERFQTAPGGAKGIPVFLLTTQVGGLGLTLTAADRVVIVDPSWNPATDNQSVDRAYRIGQSRDVVVYRLVTCGTVEEKIYRKQVFKGGLSKAGMEEGIQLRYFTHQELHELFKWDPQALNASETQQLLKQQHAQQLRQLQKQQSPELNSHMLWVEDNPLCAGTSQHGLLFSLEDPEGKDLNLAAAEKYSGGSSSQAGGSRFCDSGWHPRKAAGAGFWGPGVGAGGSGSGGSQPSAAALDEMMQSLNIGGAAPRGGLSATAAARGAMGTGMPRPGGYSQPQQQQQQQKVQELTKQVKQLQTQVQRQTCELQQLGPSLRDGGAKLAVRLEGLQAELQKAQSELQQLDPQAAAALTAAAAPNNKPAPPTTSQAGGVQGPGGNVLEAPQKQYQQQQWQHPRPPLQQQHQWQQRQPRPPPQQQRRRQQQYWADDLPPPPPGRPQQQQQSAGNPIPQPNPQQGQVGSSRPGSGVRDQQQQPPRQHQQQQRSLPLDVRTLDGRQPSMDEMKRRKHVLKKALQQEDRVKDQLKAQGREYPPEKHQQWVQMYAEYKELKEILQALQEADAQEQGAGGHGGGSRQQSHSAVIDLT